VPENDSAKLRPHPAKTLHAERGAPREPAHAYAELSVTSNFTFLTGASHPEELVERAATLGYRALAITDTNTLAGVVRAHVTAKEAGLPLAIGCRLVFSDAPPVLVYPTDRAAYSRLCNLLTLGKRRAPKGECHLALDDLLNNTRGLLALAEPPPVLDDAYTPTLRLLRDAFADRLSLAASCAYDGTDAPRLAHLAALSSTTRIPLAATNRVLYHEPQRRPLQDVLTCIRLGCTIDEAGFRLQANAERHLKPPDELARLFAPYPRAVARAVETAELAAAFSLDELKYEYPAEPCPEGLSPTDYLASLTWQGAARRYPGGIPAKARESLEYELGLIAEMKYEAYFLTCEDLVRFARSQGILCQGRGGAANSAVCYCLGITEVDPARHSLLFERFISRARNEPPDIDIDFEHERREEVIQYLYTKYGRDRAALTAEVISYRGRSAVRDVGKAMGLPADCIDALAKNLDRWGERAHDARVRELGLNPDDPTMRHVVELTAQLVGFPRHLSQHVGGFVITRTPLCDLVPIENAAMEDRTVIEWDKDDIDAMGMLKVDCLGLGMLTCIRKAFELLWPLNIRGTGPPPGWLREKATDVTAPKGRRGVATGGVGASPTEPVEQDAQRPRPGRGGGDSHPPRDPSDPGLLAIADIMDWEQGDDAVYEMVSHADTVGVFQIESRAQMSMLPRLRPRCFYDLVIEVAIVRPGPIQGGMVHPYLRRREGKDPVVYPKPEIEEVLKRTLGVPLFQEQAMRLAIVAAGFTPDQADGLRRAMAAWKRKGDAIYRYGQQLVGGMLKNGYEPEFAERCFEQIKGFSEYGFPESHAASFAILVYVSAWLKRHHAAAFAAALINSQPMGFYQPAQIVRDAKEHAVTVLPIDVNHSAWDCTLEPPASAPQHEELIVSRGLNEPRPFPAAPSARGAGGRWLPDAQRLENNPLDSSFARETSERTTPHNPASQTTTHWGHSGPALRLGMRLVKGMPETDAIKVSDAVRSHGPFHTIDSLWRASGVSTRALRCLAQADAFASMNLDRQRALWQVKPLRDDDLPLFDSSDATDESGLDRLPHIPAEHRVLHDYGSIGLSLKAHPVSFLREHLASLRVLPAADLRDEKRCPSKRRVSVAGVVLCRQRPGTASGVVFITLEDETGIANLIVWRDTFEKYRRVARLSTLLLAHGTIERQGEVVHVHVRELESLDDQAPTLQSVSRDFH
jgi:error-prone DNA polymerase